MHGADYDSVTRRALRRSVFARPSIWRFSVFSRLIWPSVCPFDHGGRDGVVVAAEAAGEGRNQATFGQVGPSCQFAPTCMAHHIGEPVCQLPGGRQGWQRCFDPRNLECIGPRQVIPSRGQEPRNPAGGW